MIIRKKGALYIASAGRLVAYGATRTEAINRLFQAVSERV